MMDCSRLFFSLSLSFSSPTYLLGKREESHDREKEKSHRPMMDPHNNNGRRRRRERERERKEGETQFFGTGAGCRCCCATTAEVARLPADRHKHKKLETKQQGHMTVRWHTIDAARGAPALVTDS
jgi:hypothetical protein